MNIEEVHDEKYYYRLDVKDKNIEQQHQLLPLSSWRIKLFDDVRVSVIDTLGHIDGTTKTEKSFMYLGWCCYSIRYWCCFLNRNN